MHDDVRDLLGAHALGQLHDPLRADLESHLEGCEDCRAELAEIAPLVIALRGVDPDALRPVGNVPSAELDRRIRQMLPDPGAADDSSGVVRRWWVAAAGIAVGAAAATGIVLTTQQDAAPPGGPTVIAVPEVATTDGITASAGLVDHSWGVEVKLEMAGLRAGERYDFRVVDAQGDARDAGEVLGVAGTTVSCSMSSSIMLADATEFDVVDESGRTVVTGAIST